MRVARNDSARTVIALALTYVLTWGGIPTPALAEMAWPGGAPPQATQGTPVVQETEKLQGAQEVQGGQGQQAQGEQAVSTAPAPTPQTGDGTGAGKPDEAELSRRARALADEIRAEAGEGVSQAALVERAYLRVAGAVAHGEDLPLVEGAADSAALAHAFALLASELGVESVEVACEGGSATWNMVRVGDAWYHVDAWSAARRYEAELREQAARRKGQSVASPEVSREWLLVGDGTLRGLDNSRVAWRLADGSDAPVAPADYDWGLPNGENEDSDKQVAMQHELVAPDGDEIGGQSKSYTNDLIADAQLMTSDTSGSVSPDSLVVSVHECDFSLSTADSIKWIPIETTTDCAAVEITITEPEDGQFDAPLSYCIYDAMSEEAHMISEKGVSLYGSYAISENDTTTLSLQKKGTYYLALFNACHINPYYYSVDSVNKQSLHLVMKTMANDSNEDNNDYKKATKLHEGSEKMFRLLGKDDVDVFKLTIPAKGEIKVGVRGEQEYFDSKIGYTIYRIVNGEMERVGDLGVSSYASFAFDEACDEVFEAPAAGTYFIEVANAHYWNPYYYSSGADNKTPLFIRYEYVRDSGAPSQEMANPAYALASVDMTLNGGTRDLLTTAKTLDVAAADTVFTLTARLENDDVTPRGFKLYQKSGETYRQISEAGSNGYFGAISYDAFTPGEVVYVSVVGENGEIAQTRQLLLKVEDSRQADVPATFSIGDGVTITFGQNAWPLSGMELSLPVTEFPISFDVSSDGKVRLGVNLDVKMEADNDPSWFEKLHDPKYIGEMLTGAQSKRLKKGLVSEKNSNFSTTVVGYAEGVIGSGKYTGMIGIKLKFAFSNEHQTAIAFVPIVIETSGSLEATGSAKATAHCENGRLVLDDASLRVGGKGSVGLYGGVGVAYLCSAGVWGDASIGLSWLFFPEAASGLEEVYVQGRLGLKALVLGKSIPLTLIDSDKIYLYKRDTSTNGLSSQSASPSDLLMSIQSDETYEPLDRSYASSTTPWEGTPAADGTTRLQGNVYPDAQVQTVPVDGGMLMTFLTDDASRGADNRTMLVWSRYDEGSRTWSEPQPVWQDGTADFTPSLCADGSGGAWVAWSNARQAVRDGLTLSEESALLDVTVARFDPNSRAMVGAEFVTNDDTAYEAAPRVGVCGGAPVLAWTRNGLDDVVGANGGCDVVVATRSGGAWAPSAVATASGMVTSLAAGGLGGAPAVAWADDADGSRETVGDSSVWAWSDGSGASALSWSDSWNPRFAESGGSSALTWCQDGTLMLTTDGYEATATSLEGLPVTAYALTGDLAGDALLSYERFEGGSGNVYGLVCSGGGWSDEVALTSQRQSVTSWGACLSGGVPSVAYAASTESELSSKDAGIWAVGGTSLRACALDTAWYENGAVRATVTNRGPVAIDSATVSASEGGSVVASAAYGVTLAPGASGEVEVSLSEPTDGRAHTYQVSVAPGLAGAEPLEVTVGEALFAMDTTHHIVDGKESFSTTVTNIGLATSESGKVVFYDLDSGSTLCERPLSALAGGERGEVTYEADGMLYEFGVSNVGVRFVADDGTTLATDVARAWQGDVDSSFDASAPGISTPIADCSVSAISAQTYTGSEVRPKPTVKHGSKTLVEGTDYTLSYKDNVNAGTATVTVTGKGGYSGTKSVTFKISRAGLSAATVTLPKSSYVYTGKAIAPAPTVRLGGRTLRAGTDYTVSYKNNVIAGTATVTVTGRGNYSGSKSATFRIVALSPTPTPSPKPQPTPTPTPTPRPTPQPTPTPTPTPAPAPEPQPARVEMHRLYNPYTGEHFYTANAGERDSLSGIGWDYEGVGWVAPATSAEPVFRLYNPFAGDHHYTTSAGERDGLVAAGWVDEGVGWRSAGEGGTPLYRQYNPYATVGTHNYTTSKDENDMLVSVGWVEEGVGWYGVA